MNYTAMITPDGAAQRTTCGTMSSASISNTARIPSHGYHRVPAVPQLSSSPELLLCAAEYVDIAVRVFDEATKTGVNDLSAVEVLDRELQKIPGPPDHWSDSSP